MAGASEAGELEIIPVADEGRWNEALADAGADDVYFQAAYARSFAANGDGDAELAVWRDRHGVVVHPYLVRSIPGTRYCDLASPYGYAGPVGSHARSGLAAFGRAFGAHCGERGLVSEFVRFHPLLENHRAAGDVYDVSRIRSTLYVDTARPMEEIEADFDGPNRNRIRKARRMGVEVSWTRDADALGRFQALYLDTMHRVGAAPYYLFSDEYFASLGALVRRSGWIVEAWYDGGVVASIVVLVGSRLGHYHLGAGDSAHRSVPATNLLFSEAIRRVHEEGLTAFHLGGGYSGDDDSLFRFKRRFSPSRAGYHVGRRIHLRDVYDRLVRERLGERELRERSFFPLYRAGSKHDD